MARTSTAKRILFFAIIAALALVALAACSGTDDAEDSDDTAASLTVRDAWVRATVPGDTGDTAESDAESGDMGADMGEDMDMGGGSMTGAFMVIENPGADAEYLVSVAADESIATTVELHETTLDDNDVMRMRPVERIEVPAEGAVELKPGSYHVMLIGVQQALDPGDTVTLTLAFESGKEITVDADVREVSG